MKTLVAPSILASDFSNLEKEIVNIDKAGADIIHLDIMDGCFVPNISFGPSVVESIRGKTKIFFDVHLMIENPDKYIDEFVKAGADGITIHLESYENENMVLKTINKINNLNIKSAISINPKTKAEEVFPYIKDIDMVLVMSVEPGFGGQSFMEDSLEKVKKIRKYADDIGKKNFNIQIDGGISKLNAKKVVDAGANILVAGTSVFGEKDYKKAIEDLRINKG